jgi:hypothetical protein
MEHINSYTTYLLKQCIKRNDGKHSEKNRGFTKPNKNMHFSSGSLYYELNQSENNFDKLTESTIANLILLKEDLLSDLNVTENLYTISEEGEFTLSNFHLT